jgi:hypothetical protein
VDYKTNLLLELLSWSYLGILDVEEKLGFQPLDEDDLNRGQGSIYIGQWDEREPLDQIDLNNGWDAIFKAVEDRRHKPADRWGHPRSADLAPRSADLALCQVGPTLEGLISWVF